MTASKPGRGGSDNRKLYQEGEHYLRELPVLPQDEKYPQATLKPVAAKYVTSVAEVRTAVEFVAAVDRIARAAGASAKELILSGQNILLTPVLVGRLCKLSPERLQEALRNAAEGRHPRARPVPEDTPPDLARWDDHLHRLQRASNLLTQEDQLRPASLLSPEEKQAVYRKATATRAALSALLLALRSFGGSDRAPPRRAPRAMVHKVPLLTTVKRVRAEAERVTHDVPLDLSQHGASPPALRALTAAATDLCDWANCLAEHTRLFAWPPPPAPSLLCEHAREPGAGAGTYIMILHADQPAVRRIGRLETFWLPAGFFLYVGSACGGGGVRARTTRHGHSTACRMWNLDHIKAIARPVEVWWTHHGREETVECPWALALAELPDYLCPAPGFGSNDCKSCPAHFYHTLKRPSCQAFAAVVGQETPGHGLICRHRFS